MTGAKARRRRMTVRPNPALLALVAITALGMAATAEAKTLVFCPAGGPEGFDPAPFTPPPAWLRYDHRAAGRLWPPVTAARRDPEDVQYELPPGLAGYAHAARERLLAASLPAVVGHAALSGLHVRWLDGPKGAPVAVVHGWEELAARPEAALVGCLAASFNELPDQPRIAPVVEGERVLAAYQAASGRTFTTEEVEVAWAASAWVACYTAAMEHVSGAPGQATHQVVTDGQLRLHLAGC